MSPAQRHAQLKALFQEVLNLPQAEKGSRLAHIAADMPDIHDDLVQLLKNHETADPTRLIVQAPLEPSPVPLKTARISAKLSRLFKRKILLLPLAVLLLSLAGLAGFQALESAYSDVVAKQLSAVLRADREALQVWLSLNQDNMQRRASEPGVIHATQVLVNIGRNSSDLKSDLAISPSQDYLRLRFGPLMEKNPGSVWALIDFEGRVLADSHDTGLALQFNERIFKYLIVTKQGAATFIPPYLSGSFVLEPEKFKHLGFPYTAFMAPVFNNQGLAIAALVIAEPADNNFSSILNVARVGDSGETYAVNDDGFLLSGSRYDQELRDAGLLMLGQSETLNIRLQVPQHDLSSAPQPTEIMLAMRQTTHSAGVVTRAYKNYLDKPVVGAWLELDGQAFTLITEVSSREAYAPMLFLRAIFIGMFGVLTLISLYALNNAFSLVNLRREVAAAEQLGQYTLLEKIGEGGMGDVYKAQHAMLKRPTVIKLIKPELATPEITARFEREVQVAAQLRHPNTVAIYDFGRNRDGVFYFAMEYINGIDLGQLAAYQAPVAPARVIHILRQVCGSLREAHQQGFIHRDIKPANIMLALSGGEFDVAKVLDFGLVKDLKTPQQDTQLTQLGAAAGTPAFMAPERLQNPMAVDARADIYALGAVAYRLLSGHDAIAGDTQVDIMFKAVNARPKTLNIEPQALADLIAQCLEKSPEARPQSVAAMIETLDALALLYPWTQHEAEACWQALLSDKNAPVLAVSA